MVRQKDNFLGNHFLVVRDMDMDRKILTAESILSFSSHLELWYIHTLNHFGFLREGSPVYDHSGEWRSKYQVCQTFGPCLL